MSGRVDGVCQDAGNEFAAYEDRSISVHMGEPHQRNYGFWVGDDGLALAIVYRPEGVIYYLPCGG